MSAKCEHSSTIILFSEGGLSVERCTWTCGDLLVSRQQPNDVWVTQAVGEIAALQAQIAKYEYLETIARDVDMWLVQNKMRGTAHQISLSNALKELGK